MKPKFTIYDFYPDFKEGEMLRVQIPNNIVIKGKFIRWKDKIDKELGKQLKIERTYENYILTIARVLDENSITVEEFLERIKKET